MRPLLFLTICVYLSSFLGCAPKPEAPSEDGAEVLEVWQAFTTEETVVFREMMAEFEKEWEAENGRPLDVRVQYVSYNDMFTKLKTAALANITPDVAFLDAIKVTDLAFGNALIRIDELPGFVEKYETIDKAREEFVSASFNAGVVNRLGEVGLYGLPIQTTTVALFWNRELFRNRSAELVAAGLDPNRAPRDWDEMLTYGKVLTDTSRGIYAYGAAGSLWFNFPILNMYNVPVIEYAPDGTATASLDNANGRAALERILSLTNSGFEGGAWKRSALSPDAGFLNKKYAMILTGPWNVENFTNAGLDFDIALIPAPTAEEIERLDLQAVDPELKDEIGNLAYTSSNVGGQTGVVLRSCGNPDVALEMLEYFTSEKSQRRWASGLGQIPVRLSAWDNLDMSKYPYIPKFMLQLRTARRIPQIPLYGILENDIFNPQIDLLLQNSQTPAAMLGKMETILNARILEPMNEATRNRVGGNE